MVAAYSALFQTVYPAAIIQRHRTALVWVDHVYLQRLCDALYARDTEDLLCVSCFSVAVTVQMIAYAAGRRTRLHIGLVRRDRKLVGHAWLVCADATGRKLVNPGRIPIDDMRVTQRLTPSAAVEDALQEAMSWGLGLQYSVSPAAVLRCGASELFRNSTGSRFSVSRVMMT